MCGRYTLHTEKELLLARFDLDPADLGLEPWTPRYNIAPTQPVLAVIEREGRRRAGYLHWGLVPHWTAPDEHPRGLINARAETADRKPAFRDAWQHGRCWVLASGFYEWQAPRGASRRKVPHWISRGDGKAFAMAGLWSTWRRPDAPPLHGCAILTTDANAAVREIHARMPVILDPGREADWLAPGRSPEQLRAALEPLDAALLEARPVSTAVNRVTRDDASLLEPSDDPQLGFL